MGALGSWARPAPEGHRMVPDTHFHFLEVQEFYEKECEPSSQLGLTPLGPLSWPGEFSQSRLNWIKK